MNKLNFFIVEDDIEALESLLNLLIPYGNILNLDSLVIAKSFVEAQNCIIQTKGFDVSILDKNLDEGESCFSLITEKNINKLGLRVFNTIETSDQDLLKKMQISSGHLVLGKPYTVKSVAKLMSEINERQALNLNEKTSDYITTKVKEAHIFLRKKNIIAIEVNGNYPTYYYKTDEGKFVSYLGSAAQSPKLLSELGEDQFQEIHRGALINIQFIDKISKRDKSVVMIGFVKEFTISDRFTEALEARGLWP